MKACCGAMPETATWRIAVGAQAGRTVLTLQTLPAGDSGQAHTAGNVDGFSPHAGAAVRTKQRNKRERLCRNISRTAAWSGVRRRILYRGQGWL
jgi:hypothetical protein